MTNQKDDEEEEEERDEEAVKGETMCNVSVVEDGVDDKEFS